MVSCRLSVSWVLPSSFLRLARAILGYQVPLLKYTFFIHIRTGLLIGMPPRHQDTWSRSSPSWYRKDWESSASGGDRASDGIGGWSQRDTRGTSSSGHADNTETWEETKDKFLNITPDELWRLQKILSNKKGTWSQTYKKNTEANAQVYDLNQKTMQPMALLPTLIAGGSVCVDMTGKTPGWVECYRRGEMEEQSALFGKRCWRWRDLDTMQVK